MEGKRPAAFVTGASPGLGAAIALRLARDGYDIAIARSRPDTLADLAARVEALGARAVSLTLDLRSEASIEDAFGAVLQNFNTLDLLVNNAGVTMRKRAIDVSREEWQSIMDVNLTGTFFVSQHYARALAARKLGGSIVNIASTHGLLALAQRSTYGISKAGVIHMTRMLAFEWAELGIRVNAIAPGTVDTPSRMAYFNAHPDEHVSMIERVPVKRFATVDEVAAAVAYLASPGASYITGHTLVLDGGLTSY
jgi:NAD(P)-dependent dehydrogenase (short-subunit alcohol dehydrogenase family)